VTADDHAFEAEESFMSDPPVELKDSSEASTTPGMPAGLRLVAAFAEAVERSPRDDRPAVEATAIEDLLIAAEASYTALERLEELQRRDRDGPDSGAVNGEGIVLDGFVAWFEVARSLRDRIDQLKATEATSAYESGAADRLAAILAADDERRDMLRLERVALNGGQLADLAARLHPIAAKYD